MFLIAETCGKLGIKQLSFFVFGIENLKRNKEEVDTLTNLFRELADKMHK